MIHILSTCYNCKQYIDRCINSIKRQTVNDFKVWIMDDVSTDGTTEHVEKLIKGDTRFVHVVRKEKFWQGRNYYDIIFNNPKEIKNEDICITVDADDFLPNSKTFERVLNYYSDGKTWVTYGQFVYWEGDTKPFKMGFAEPPRRGIRGMRKDVGFTTTHLRTWLAGLYRKIDENSLTDNNREWLPYSNDIPLMCSLLEMAGDEHSKFTNDINYCYNIVTALNEFKLDYPKTQKCAEIFRNKPQYKQLELL